MVSGKHFFSVFTITLAVFTVNFVKCAPIDSLIADAVEHSMHLPNHHAQIDEHNSNKHHYMGSSKRDIPMEGILIGKREYPMEGILLGKRDEYPTEGISLGKREYPMEGILLGKREYPTEGILLGKREYPTEGILLGKREYPTEGIYLGKRNFRYFAPKLSASAQNPTEEK